MCSWFDNSFKDKKYGFFHKMKKPAPTATKMVTIETGLTEVSDDLLDRGERRRLTIIVVAVESIGENGRVQLSKLEHVDSRQ